MDYNHIKITWNSNELFLGLFLFSSFNLQGDLVGSIVDYLNGIRPKVKIWLFLLIKIGLKYKVELSGNLLARCQALVKISLFFHIHITQSADVDIAYKHKVAITSIIVFSRLSLFFKQRGFISYSDHCPFVIFFSL